MAKLVMAKKIAIVSTILNILGIAIAGANETIASIMLLIGIIGAIISYCFGGFGNVLKVAGAFAKIGWVVAPFPMDIPIGMSTFVGTVIAFLFIPIVPVLKAYRDAEKMEIQS